MFEVMEENEKHLVLNKEMDIAIHENALLKVETKDCVVLDIDRTCRVCLEIQEAENLYSLYGIDQYFSETSIFQVIYECFGVMLQPDDMLPSVICSHCALSTLQACNFKHTMLNSEYLLTNIETDVANVNPKEAASPSLTDDSFSSISFDHNYSVKSGTQNDSQNKIDIDEFEESKMCIEKDEVPNENFQLYDTSEKWWLMDLGSPYDCRICNHIFDNYIDLYSHVRNHFIHHSICMHCGENTVTGNNHLCTQSEESNICVYCLIVCKTSEELEKHLMTHTPEVMHMHLCDVCGEGFQETSALESHRLSHCGTSPQYVCEICGETFAQLQTYRNHETTFHSNNRVQDDQIHKCAHCLKVFSNPKSLAQHYKMHTTEAQLKCDICGSTFRLLFSYNVHMFLHKVRASTFNSMSLNCAFCFDMFTNKEDLEEHLLDHIDKPYQCHECHKFFPTKAKLKQHLTYHSGKRPYACEFCSKTFRNPTTLYQHRKIHIGKKPYVCKVCHRSFIQQQQLSSHMFTHTGEKNYVCQYCGKAFALNGNLTVHVRRHTGDTPFHCSTCGKGFYDSSTLKKHIVWKHTGEV